MAFNSTTERLISLKKLSGKAHTSNDKGLSNEALSSGITISSSTVFSEAITGSPTATPYWNNGVVEFLRLEVEFITGADTPSGRHGFRLKLPSDYVSNSSNPKKGAQGANNGNGTGTGVFTNSAILNESVGKIQLVPPSFANAYEAKPHYGTVGSGTRIYLLDDRDWNLDYFNGVLFQQNPPGTGNHAQNPTYVEAFIYIGEFLDSTLGASSGDITEVIAGTGLTGGANSGSATLNIDDSVVATLTGSIFSGNVVAQSGLSGSLQNLADGSSYLIEGTNISIVSGSNGSITISADAYTAGEGLDISNNNEFSLDLKSTGGLKIDASELALDLNSLPSTTAHLDDSIAIVDDSDSNLTKKITLSMLQTALGVGTANLFSTIKVGNSNTVLRFTGNFGMGNFGYVSSGNIGANGGRLNFSDGSNQVSIVAMDYGSASSGNAGDILIAINTTATKTNLHNATFTITDSSSTQVQFTFDNTVSTTTGSTIGLQNADDIDTISARIVSTINANSFSASASDYSGYPVPGANDLHVIKVGSLNSTTTYSTSTTHIDFFFTVLAGGDWSASDNIDSIVSKINARTQLNLTATAASNNSSSDASLTVAHSSGGTATVVEDSNFNSGVFGGSAGFATIAASGQADVVADSSSDTLTILEGNSVTITSNASTDTITIASSDTVYTAGDGLSLSNSNEFSTDLKSSSGLKIDGGKLAIEPSDFAGSGLSDDGSDSLVMDVFNLPIDSQAGNLLDSIAISDSSSGNVTKRITIDALKDLMMSGSGRDKEVYQVTQNVSALTNVSIQNSNAASVNYDPDSIDLFYNGMLLHSGSLQDVQNDDADYSLTGPSTFKTNFILQAGDLIDVIISDSNAATLSNSAPYITFEAHNILSNERVIRASDFLSITTGSSGFIDLDISRKKISHEVQSTLTSGDSFSSGLDFSKANYDPQRIDVYVNGVLMMSGSSHDYTIQSNSSIIFYFDLLANDHVIISMI